jgi:hypothetical protein
MKARQGAMMSNEERGVVDAHSCDMPVAADASHDNFDQEMGIPLVFWLLVVKSRAQTDTCISGMRRGAPRNEE